MRGAARRARKIAGPLRVAEVGVRLGEHAQELLVNLNIERLYLVDSYAPYQDQDTFIDAQQQALFYYKMFQNLRYFWNKVVLVTRDSEFASSLFPDRYFDFVYIDGAHDLEHVRADLRYWWPKVKRGGVFGGHDINFPTVKQAVLEFTEQHKLSLTERSQDWVIVKPE